MNFAVAAMLIPFVCRAQLNPRNYRDAEVEALLAPLGAATNVSVYHLRDQTSRGYKQMVEELKEASPETLRLLMTEITNVGVLEKDIPLGLKGNAAFRAYRLSEAFRIAGTNVTSLFSALTNEFLSGRSVYGSESGLLALGSASSPIFLQGLTNSDLRVEAASSEAMSFVKGSDALLGFPYLCDLLKNRSLPLQLRAGSIQSIRESINPKMAVPVLLQIAQTETNVMLRCLAIKGLNPPGPFTNSVLGFLRRALEDRERTVRLTAGNVLQEIRDLK